MDVIGHYLLTAAQCETAYVVHVWDVLKSLEVSMWNVATTLQPNAGQLVYQTNRPTLLANNIGGLTVAAELPGLHVEIAVVWIGGGELCIKLFSVLTNHSHVSDLRRPIPRINLISAHKTHTANTCHAWKHMRSIHF